MDAVDDRIGPQAPVGGGREVECVPRGSSKYCAAIIGGDELEFTPLTDHGVLDVGRIDFIPRAPFVHRWRLFCDIKAQAVWGVPVSHGLYKGPCREFAVPHRADAFSVDPCAHGCGDSGVEDPVGWWGNSENPITLGQTS